MNQRNQSKQNSQNQKFNQQLNHLSSVVGLANWQFSSPTSEQMKAYEQKGRQLRASESRRLISGAIRRITTGLIEATSTVVSDFKRRQQRRKGIERLQQLSDHMLRDIGISRSDVMALASHKISSDEINAQRLGRRAVTTKVAAQAVQHPSRIDRQRSSANDPHYLQESA